ncbi:hypothetical protein WICMUC_004589 [Wickerhamomyces mucosus]|uniref:Uncharacterized protein n=1 Tax=Wickerhamomyces mucosus TaxID=1378264 RepID=A0A9P8PHN9_9ASCO|nr:hypothetical protein WICMUC_004589 [Wickerhamomyces mucosus]
MKLQGPLEVLSQEEYHTISQDVTTFLRVVSIISLVVNSFGTFFTCISTYILGIGLFRVANRIVRDEENESASVFELSPSVYFEASHVDALRSSQLCEQIQLEFIR